MSSALSITRSVRPPRASYLDYPLGHTSGKPHAPDLQIDILRNTLTAFVELTTPDSVLMLPYRWSSDDAWKDQVMRPATDDHEKLTSRSADNRLSRLKEPQYQYEQDRLMAEANFGENGCPTCIFLEDK